MHIYIPIFIVPAQISNFLPSTNYSKAGKVQVNALESGAVESTAGSNQNLLMVSR